MTGQVIEHLIRLQKKDIAYVRHIFEGYDGIAHVTTVDRLQSIVKVVAVSDFKEIVGMVLERLGTEITMELLGKEFSER